MKILVTGGNGFVGRSCVAHLLARGDEVKALVLPKEAVPETWTGNVEVTRGDIADETAVSNAMNGCEAVIHLAAHVALWDKPEVYERVTIGGTQRVLSAAAKISARVVLLSSITVYGDALTRDVCDEDHVFDTPQGMYGASKQAQEKLVREFEKTHGASTTIVRAGPVYGPHCLAWVDAFAYLLRRRWPCYIGDGTQNSNLCYVENLAALLALAASTPRAAGRTYNAIDDDLSWGKYVGDLASKINAKSPVSMSHRRALRTALCSEFACRHLGRFFPNLKKVAFTREACNLMSGGGKVPNERAKNELGFTPPVAYEEAMNEIAIYINKDSSE